MREAATDDAAVEAWHFEHSHPPRPRDLSRQALSSHQWEAVEKIARSSWAAAARPGGGEAAGQEADWDALGLEIQNEQRHRIGCAMKLLCLKYRVVPAAAQSPSLGASEDSPTAGLWHDRELLDLIAKDVHDRWALGKFREGYGYGPVATCQAPS